MKFLKGLAIGLLSFLLFLSLSIFGIAFLLNQTILNPNFITSELDKLDVSSLAEELISEQVSEEEFPEELGAALIDTITKLESPVKEQINAATYSIFDYLLGKRQSPDLALTLRNTFLNTDFVVSLVNELDIASLAGEILSEQLTGNIPEEMEFLTEHLDDIIAELEPTIKEELIAAADPIFDYLLGESQSISIVISLEPIIENLEDTLREALMDSLPPEYAHLPQSELNQLFDEYFAELAEMIPATVEIDETLLGTEVPAQISEALAGAEEELEQARQGIADALAEAEEGLELARQYVGYFQLGYKILIGFILLLIAGIVLLNREVRGATRKVGTIFLTCGVPWFAGILVAKYFAGKQIAQLDIPPYFQELLPRLVNAFSAPLQWFSLGLLIGGVALIVVSFVYPRWRRTAS